MPTLISPEGESVDIPDEAGARALLALGWEADEESQETAKPQGVAKKATAKKAASSKSNDKE